MSKAFNIAVIGAGSWGTAVANLLSKKGLDVVLWCRRGALKEVMLFCRKNLPYLPGVRLSSSLRFSTDLQEAFDADVVIIAVPTQFVSDILHKVSLSSRDSLFVSLSKGIEVSTRRRVSQILIEELSIPDERVAVLSGPSHAEEVAMEVPTSVVVASCSEETAIFVQNLFSTEYFRVYRSTDVIGVELGGALKNIIAIAAGMLQGIGMGDNTHAALITRGLAEITRFGVRLGADPLTFSGLSGLGDLVVTCISDHSRNRYVGYEIGKGRKLQEVLSDMRMVAEGVSTTDAVYHWSMELKVPMPITREVYNVLFDGKSPYDAIKDLMTRPLKPERYWSD